MTQRGLGTPVEDPEPRTINSERSALDAPSATPLGETLLISMSTALVEHLYSRPVNPYQINDKS